ncbi:uncharacterized [Tachysurus ichikawai]
MPRVCRVNGKQKEAREDGFGKLALASAVVLRIRHETGMRNWAEHPVSTESSLLLSSSTLSSPYTPIITAVIHHWLRHAGCLFGHFSKILMQEERVVQNHITRNPM